MNTLKVGVVIARFQPLLRGQVEHLLVPATQNSDLVIVLLGSSMKARTCVEPLSNENREEIIKRSLVGDNIRYSGLQTNDCTVVFEPIRDFFYAETPVDWITQVQSVVNSAIKKNVPLAVRVRVDVEVTLYGAESEDTRQYHEWFPQWNREIADIRNLNLDAKVLAYLFEEDYTSLNNHITGQTYNFLVDWLKSAEGTRLQKEYSYVKDYKERTQTGKFPIQFLTVDNVVYYKGNILLVKRRSQPGKGLWALPGGFLEATETCKDGAVRELLEETRLRVRQEWLVARDCFDHPRRSTRGRTLTNAFLWKIPDGNNFPKVRAGSDAARVKWFPLAHILEEMPDKLFEDHLDIISTLTKRL